MATFLLIFSVCLIYPLFFTRKPKDKEEEEEGKPNFFVAFTNLPFPLSNRKAPARRICLISYGSVRLRSPCRDGYICASLDFTNEQICSLLH